MIDHRFDDAHFPVNGAGKNGNTVTSEILDRQPPRSLEAERAVIGSMLLRPAAYDEVAAVVQATDFYDEAHQRLYRHVQAMHKDGQRTDDLQLLHERLKGSRDAEFVGGLQYLTELALSRGISTHALHYARIVRDCSGRRQALRIATELLQDIYAPESRPELFLFDAAERLTELHAGTAGGGADRFTVERMTSAEFDGKDCTPVWLIEQFIHQWEQLVIAAPMKGMKTTLSVMIAIHLALGLELFGRFAVPRAVNVLLFSGESGWGTLQGLARRIAGSLGFSLADCNKLFWSKSLPRIGEHAHEQALREAIIKDEIEVVILDPLYFCLPGQDAGNLMIMGSLLRSLSKLCEELKVTLIVVHHVKKTAANPFDPPELADVSWSGTAEWARQWLLMGRRKPHEAGTGLHEMWLNCGGSAGHGSLWGLNIFERVYPNKTWEVELLRPEEVRETEADSKDEAKETKRQEQVDRDVKAIVRALAKFPAGETKNIFRDAAGLSGQRCNLALAAALDAGHIVACEVLKGNQKTPREGYKLSNSEAQK